jgi:hypothetical protein
VRLGRRIGSTALEPAEPTGVLRQGFVLPHALAARPQLAARAEEAFTPGEIFVSPHARQIMRRIAAI